MKIFFLTLSVIIFIILPSFLFCKFSYAFSDINEDFINYSFDTNIWNVFSNQQQTYAFESNSKIRIPKELDWQQIYPLIYTKDMFIARDFNLEIKFKYKKNNYHGLGIMLVNSNLDIENFITDHIQYPVFSIWEDIPGGLRFKIYKDKCFDWGDNCSGITTYRKTTGPLGVYKIIITKNQNILNFELFENNVSVLKSINLPLNDMQINHIFLGHPPIPNIPINDTRWSTITIDYIRLTNIVSSPPLVFIPGYMASFDWEDMVSGRNDHQWQRNPVEKVYDNFWATLKGLGYSDTATGNLQRWDYDFRRPLPEIAAKFKTWFDSYLATQPLNTKVILVGHSFGGLVARQYLKDNPTNHVDKLITVGSPHEGVLDTYPMLAAGVSGVSDISQKAIFETIMRWHGKNFLTKKQVVQSVLPSAQDLIPIFSSGFLKNAANQNINSTFINSNLTALKAAPIPTITIKIIRGTNIQTKEFYKLTPRSFLDQVLNDWPDGKIESTEYSTQGDNTVLTKSSTLADIIPFEIAGATHTDIITEPAGIRKILEYAGIPCDNCTIVDNAVASPQKAILLLLKSPAEIKVKDLVSNGEIGHGVTTPNINGAITAYNNKFIYIPTEDQKRYSIEVTGMDSGEYQLDVGSLDVNSSSSFLTFNKQTEIGKVDAYQVKYEQNGNLVHLTDVEIINPYDSSKKILSEFEQTPLITDLISDCDLVKKLVEINHDYANALRQIQKMLVKTFQLRESINFANDTNKVYLLNKTVDLLKMEREMFKIVNNQNGRFGLVASQNSTTSLNQILTTSENELAQKQNLQDFDVESFKKAKEFNDEGNKEFQASLAGQSYFTFQISRFLANESLK